MNVKTALHGVILVAISAGPAAAGVTFLSQERRITAHTTFDGSTVEASATGFELFETIVNASVLFPSAQGNRENFANAGISCTFEFGKFRARGRLEGAGGVALLPGGPQTVVGWATAYTMFTFETDEVYPWEVRADSLDGSGGGENGGNFAVILRSLDTGETLFFADRGSGLDAISVGGILPAGRYSVSYTTDLIADDDGHGDEYDFEFRVPGPGGASIMAMAGLAVFGRRRGAAAYRGG